MSYSRQGRHSRGGALPLILLTLAVAAAWSAAQAPPSRRAAAIARTSAALGEARETLLGYAASYPDRINAAFGPGYLPCPARDLTGIAGPACSAAGGTAFGRLPWHTLRANDLRDGAGEGLWYALSDSHRNNPKREPLHPASPPGLLAHDRPALAVVLAPGAAMGAQDGRRSAPQEAAQFLEETNAAPSGSRFAPPRQGNDSLVAIAPATLEAVQAARALGELRARLRAYAAAHDGHYPWLVPPAAPSTAAPGVVGTQAGWLPVHGLEPGVDDEYVFELAPEWALTWPAVARSGAMGLLPPDCLLRSPCTAADGQTLHPRGEARCRWWAPAAGPWPRRQLARCTWQARVDVADVTLRFRLEFTLVDDDGDIERVGPTATQLRTRTLRTTELAAHSDAELPRFELLLEARAADGRLELAHIALAAATTGAVALREIPYALDVEAGELPGWLVRNGWHRRVAFAHAPCTTNGPCLAWRPDATPVAPRRRARALLLAPGPHAALAAASGLTAFLTDNRAALASPLRTFVGRVQPPPHADRVLVVEQAP